MAASNFKGPGNELINRVLLFVPAAAAFLRKRCRRSFVQATLSEVGFVDISVVVVGVASTATPLFSRRHRDGRCRRQRHRRWPGRRMTQTWKRQRNLIKFPGDSKRWVEASLSFRFSFKLPNTCSSPFIKFGPTPDYNGTFEMPRINLPYLVHEIKQEHPLCNFRLGS